MYTTYSGIHHPEYLIEYINDIIKGESSPLVLIIIIIFTIGVAVFGPKLKKYIEQKFEDDPNAEIKMKLIGLVICMLIAACFIICLLQISL